MQYNCFFRIISGKMCKLQVPIYVHIYFENIPVFFLFEVLQCNYTRAEMLNYLFRYCKLYFRLKQQQCCYKKLNFLKHCWLKTVVYIVQYMAIFLDTHNSIN